jgi:hypothetical protein
MDSIWLDENIKMPCKFLKSYTIYQFNGETFNYKDEILEWLKSEKISRSDIIVIEINTEYDRKLLQSYWASMKMFSKIMRLVYQNKAYLLHIVSFLNGKITSIISNDDPRPKFLMNNYEKISLIKLELLEQYILKFNDVIASEIKSQRISIALRAWDACSCFADYENMAVELFIALESLFTTDNNEVSYKLANRMAWFCYPESSKERFEMFTLVKKGYNIRSKVVHGQKFISNEDIELIKVVHNETRRILINILDNLELIEIFCRENSKLDDYFNRISLGLKNGNK